ncbi:MAG: hypothetical protein KatS3mg111_2302 [Pirellulaceae bacterium]|nr:MAG: hypothetical protein KatS3mg111_2302 [Pirellulaceae bacterium]
MPIKLKCKCGQVLTVADNLAGKVGKCPKCKSAIKIPVAENTCPSDCLPHRSPSGKQGIIRR